MFSILVNKIEHLLLFYQPTFVKDGITQNNPKQSRTTQEQSRTTQSNPKQPRTAQRYGKNNMQVISTVLAVTELRPPRSIIYIYLNYF